MRIPLLWFPEVKPKGKQATKHAKTRSDNPEIAIAKVEAAVAKRLRRQERNKNVLQKTSTI